MTTLATAPLAPLLNRLFDEADASEVEVEAAMAGLSDEERARLMRSKTEYHDRYGRLKNAPLAVSRETAALLYMLARSTRARTIIEFGTSFGISTLHLAAALRDKGGTTSNSTAAPLVPIGVLVDSASGPFPGQHCSPY